MRQILNLPDAFSNGGIVVDVLAITSTYVMQIAYNLRDNKDIITAMRQNYVGTWQPWEYVNPPMELGIEYRTTERYLGKTVYTQVFKAFDSLAKGGSVYDAPISNVYRVISCTGESGGWNLPSDVIGGEVAGNFIHIGTQKGSTTVQVYATTNRENWQAPVYVTLKYTKTTD